jgi:3-oxoacyl-[acyl-carrier-protein] synthase-3
MSSVPVSLIDVATYLPPNRVPAEYYANRRHSAAQESNVDMIERAAARLVRWGGRRT